MKLRSSSRFAGALALGALVGVLAGGDFTFAAFGSAADSAGNRVSAANDFRAPTIGATAIAKSSGGTPGFVKQGGGYHVYANVTDSGNPASGVASVTADASQLTTGAGAAALAAGSYSVGGSSYNYRSAALTADGSLPAGAKMYSLSAGDSATNAVSQGGFSVTVDNSAPSASDVQSANGGGAAGKAEQGDTVTFSFSEPIEPASVLAGWDGGATNVVVRIVNPNLGVGSDTLQVYDASNSAPLALGTVDLAAAGYVGGLLGGETALFGATGTASTMTASGSTITIALGTASGQPTTTALLAGTMSWSPSASATDRAGNAMSTAAANESGAADKEF